MVTAMGLNAMTAGEGMRGSREEKFLIGKQLRSIIHTWCGYHDTAHNKELKALID